MATDYVAQISKIISDTKHDAAGYRAMLASVGRIIEELQVEATFMVNQRDKAMRLYEQLRYQAENFFPSEEFAGITHPSVPGDGRFQQEAHLRNDILEMAQAVQSDEITPTHVREFAARKGYDLPWRNPNAVISTILNGSSRWEKVGTGRYRRTKVSNTE